MVGAGKSMEAARGAGGKGWAGEATGCVLARGANAGLAYVIH